MTEKEDLLLEFTPDQYKKYISILSSAQKGKIEIELLPHRDLPESIDPSELKDLLSDIIFESERLTESGAYSDSVWSSSWLSREEKEKYMVLCYGVINAISGISSRLMELSRSVAKKHGLLNEAYLYRIRIYQSYLPYRAALGDIDVYKTELSKTEELLLSDINLSLRSFQYSKLTLDVISFVCEDAIPSFLSKLGAATGAPPYTDLSQSKVLAAARVLCEQIKAQMHRISV